MKTIQSVEKAILILTYIANHNGELSLSELSRELSVAVTTLHGFIATLEKWGMVRKNCETGKYALGERVLQFGMLCDRETALKNLVHPFLKELQEEIGETVHLAVPFGSTQILYIDKVECTRPLRMTSVVGKVEDMTGSAVGMAIAQARQADVQPDGLVAMERFEGRPFCSREMEELDACCLAVAFPYVPGGSCASISVVIPQCRYSDKLRKKSIIKLSDAVRNIEQVLAGSPLEHTGV